MILSKYLKMLLIVDLDEGSLSFLHLVMTLILF